MHVQWTNPQAAVSISLFALVIVGTWYALTHFGRRVNLDVRATVFGVSASLVLLGEIALATAVGFPAVSATTDALRYLPVHYIDLLDDSGSEAIHVKTGALELADEGSTKYSVGAAALLQFVKMHKLDRFALTTVSDSPKVLTELTSTASVNTLKALSAYRPRFQGTDLVAGLSSAIEQFKRDDYAGPKALIVTSDGMDSIPPNAMEWLAEELGALKVQVFELSVLTDYENAASYLQNQDMARLLSRVNGYSLIATGPREAEDAYARISELVGVHLETSVSSVVISLVPVLVPLGSSMFIIGFLFMFAAFCFQPAQKNGVNK